MNESLNDHLISVSETPTSVEAVALAASESLRHSAARAHDAILALGSENENLKRSGAVVESERDTLKRERNLLESERETLQRDLEEARVQVMLVQTRNGQLHEENLRLEQNCNNANAKHDQLNADIERKHADLQCEREENRALREHIKELHFDLMGEDLPMLALKMAMQLTGAEVGLFTEADGDGVLARVGLQELEDFLAQTVYDYSRRTAASEEPTVENNAKNLPDGAGLVNLAALPFAAKGEMRGVLLLANKRNGPFTDAECQILLAIGQHAGLAMENAKLHRQLVEAYTSTVAVLADAIEAKDAYTRGHCEGVSRVSVEVARRLGVTDGALDAVRYAALLHDVGKIGIPDGILLKPGKLMPEEFSIIQKHAAIGRDLINRVPALSHIGDAILHHHERFDGSGYPDGLDGESIPLAARIICAVDAFDAMTSPRPYREAVAWTLAFDELQRCAGTQFDPNIVTIVTQVIQETETEIEKETDTQS